MTAACLLPASATQRNTELLDSLLSYLVLDVTLSLVTQLKKNYTATVDFPLPLLPLYCIYTDLTHTTERSPPTTPTTATCAKPVTQQT